MAVMFRITGSGERERYYYFGREITRAEYDRLIEEHRPPEVGGGERGSSLVGWKPYYSETMAYNPRQIPEAKAFLEKHGLPTVIDATGRPLMQSREHRKKLMKLQRYHDNDGGYGDG